MFRTFNNSELASKFAVENVPPVGGSTTDPTGGSGSGTGSGG